MKRYQKRPEYRRFVNGLVNRVVEAAATLCGDEPVINAAARIALSDAQHANNALRFEVTCAAFHRIYGADPVLYGL